MGRLIIAAARASSITSRTRSTLGSTSATADPDQPNLRPGEAAVARVPNMAGGWGAVRLGPSNPVAAVLLSPPERICEIAEILATGLMRLRARKSSQISPDGGESSLDCAGTQSGHANALKTHGGLD